MSADRSEDNSSNSSSSSTPVSQSNSANTSPEHKTLPVESPAKEHDSQLSVEVEGDDSKFSIHMSGDNSEPLADSAIVLQDSMQVSMAASDTHDSNSVNANANNLNGSLTQKTIVENGASTTQNGVSHTHQLNGGSDKRSVSDVISCLSV